MYTNDFKNCTNSTETYALVAKIVSNTKLAEVQKALSEKFYNIDNVVEFLYLTFTAKGNAILYGPGGFGKSNITKAFLNFFNIPIITKVGHSSMDVESLLGIPNIKKLTEESKYEISFENSVFNIPGVLILEEFLDVRPTVAAALKDVLTEHGYREGNTFTPSKNGPIVICSNKSPDEVSTDLSTAAFYKERFPYSLYVLWDEYKAIDYFNLYSILYDTSKEDSNKFKLLAEICAASNKNDVIISPRIAIKALELFEQAHTINNLKYISSIDLSKIDEIHHKLTVDRQYKHLHSKFDSLKRELLNFNNFSNEAAVFRLYYIVNTLRDKLLTHNFYGDLLLKDISEMIETLSTFELKLKDTFMLLGKNKTEDSLINSLYEDIFFFNK